MLTTSKKGQKGKGSVHIKKNSLFSKESRTKQGVLTTISGVFFRNSSIYLFVHYFRTTFLAFLDFFFKIYFTI